MNITETTNEVRNLFLNLDEKNTDCKLKFLLYVFAGLYNGQINNKNIANPNLVEDDDLEIFDFESIGISNDICSAFIQYLLIIYNGANKIPDEEKCIYDDGHIIGIKYQDEENELLSMYEKLSFAEKLDTIAEIIIRYDNETYFEKKVTIVSFGERSGFDIARSIQKYKKSVIK